MIMLQTVERQFDILQFLSSYWILKKKHSFQKMLSFGVLALKLYTNSSQILHAYFFIL